MRLLVGAQHTPDMPRGEAAYPESLGQTQVCFQIAPFFLLVRLLAQGTKHLEAHLHAKHEAHTQDCSLRRLAANTKDGCRSAACDTPILALLLWEPARPLWDLGLSLVTLLVKGRLVYCPKWTGLWKDSEGVGLAVETGTCVSHAFTCLGGHHPVTRRERGAIQRTPLSLPWLRAWQAQSSLTMDRNANASEGLNSRGHVETNTTWKFAARSRIWVC